MSKIRALVLVGFICIASWSLIGCDRAVTSGSSSATPSAETAGIGVPVDIGSGLSVTVVDTGSVPPGGLDSSSSPSPNWIYIEVKNSGDSSATLPSRPRRPTVVDANGSQLSVPGISTSLVNGGGGLGLAAGRLGQPYLNPGGVMRVWCQVPDWSKAKGPITVTYAIRSGEKAAVFTIE